MSAGDIDDRLGPEDQLAELRAEHPELDAYLVMAWNLAPVRTFFIPYGAGISADGARPYISNDLQSNINSIECGQALVRHETTEWGLRHFCAIGEDYANDPRGHRLANRAEHDLVLSLLDREDAWELYSMIIDPQIILAERQEFEDRAIPFDLALYPYDEDLKRKLIEAMENERSREEWSKINV